MWGKVFFFVHGVFDIFLYVGGEGEEVWQKKKQKKINFCFRLIAYRYFSVRFFSFSISPSVKHLGSIKKI